MKLGGFKVVIDVPQISPELYEVITGYRAMPLPALVASIGSIAGDALGGPDVVMAACTGWIYQDDDAHETCSLTACLNPLHPGPCKGWKGTLFKTSEGAYHALEAARVEKANAARLKKIQALKDAGKPIPKKLLTPIVAKPHPHAGKTANAATGEAHTAGQAVSDAAGVHVQTPGKVTLGQAVKQIKATDATPEKGPKGKKPTVASKGIAAVIAQEKVTPQYKLDKAAKITPDQWNGLSGDEKSIIRGELAKIQKDGFGPQQKKATELLDQLPAQGLKGGGTDTVTTPKGQVVQKISLKEIENGPEPKAPSPVKAPEAPAAAPKAPEAPAPAPEAPAPKLGAAKPKHVYTVTHNGDTITRTSTADYTHASLVQKGHDGPVVVWGFHKSEANALSTPLTSSQKQNGFKVVGALPVTKEPLKGKGASKPEIGKPEVKAEPTSHAQAAAIATISDAIPGIKSMPEGAGDKLAAAFDKLKSQGNLEDTPQFKTAVNALAQKALKTAVEDKMPGLGHGDGEVGISEFNKEIADHIKQGKTGLPPLVAKMAAHHEASKPGSVKEGIEQAAKAAHEAKVAEHEAKINAAQQKLADLKKKGEENKVALDALKKQTALVAPDGTPYTTKTPTNVVKDIQKNGYADLILGGKKIRVGFENSDHPGKLTMTNGTGIDSFYTVKEPDGTTHKLAKGEHVKVATAVEPTPTKIENAAPAAPEKTPVLAKHVQDAIDMANGTAPGASWSKNHLAAYEKLTPEEFQALPPTSRPRSSRS
jgi:hypothetical protein